MIKQLKMLYRGQMLLTILMKKKLSGHLSKKQFQKTYQKEFRIEK